MLPTDAMPALLLASFMGYFLGSIPVAAMVSRLRGVDIFAAGPGLAGATNVFRSVGPFEGFAVFIADGAKGAATVGLAYRFGLTDGLVLVPAFAALVGHWRSIFTRFRGGDGVATLVGITIVIFPTYGLLSIVIGMVVMALARIAGQPIPTIWGGTAAYGFLLLRLPMANEQPVLVVGVVLMAVLVLAHGVIGHRRRRAA